MKKLELISKQEGKVRVLHVTDIHFNPLDHIPSSRSQDYHAHVASKWNSLVKTIEDECVDLVCISGDVFNLKRKKAYSSEDLYYYSGLIENLKVPCLMVAGNHDLPKSALGNYKQSAYAVLAKSAKNADDLTFDRVRDCSFDGQVVRIAGLPYMELEPAKEGIKALQDEVESLPSVETTLAMFHLDVLPNGDAYFFESWAYPQLLDMASFADVVLLGHVHEASEVYTYKNDAAKKTQWVSKPWSFSRVANKDYVSHDTLENRHIPSISLIEVDLRKNSPTVALSNIHLDHEGFETAFNEEKLTSQLEANEKIKSFMEDLKKNFGTVDAAFKMDDHENILDEINLPEEVRKLIQEYIEKVS